MKGRVKTMMWLLIAIGSLIVATVIFFSLPYSGMLSDFKRDSQKHGDRFALKSSVFSEQELDLLPEPVRNHIIACGYIGRPKMTSLTSVMRAVPLFDSADKPPMIVDYSLRSFADEPVRLAYIRTSMYGIPFEAYDSYQSGVGFMKGVLGKAVTVFDQRGSGMDKAQLLTWLGECFLIPSSVIGGNITWEPIDATHAKASVTHNGITGSGVFTFSEQGFVESFRTAERERTNTDGSTDRPEWSAMYGDWLVQDGVYLPHRIKAVWHEESGDQVYFDATGFELIFDEDKSSTY